MTDSYLAIQTAHLKDFKEKTDLTISIEMLICTNASH